MNVGDIVTWSWYLGTDWEKALVYEVLLTDGTLCDVPENEAGLELVA